MALKFQDPPPRSAAKHQEIAEELRDHPGQWALALEAVHSTNARVIQQALNRVYQPAGSFQAVSRKRPDGKFDIYARFLGDGNQ